MKLTAILLTVFFLQVRADGLTQSISFSGKDVPLQKVFEAIKKQSGYVFFYKENILQDARPVTIIIKNVSVEEAIRQVLKDQPFDYYISKTTVVISKKKEPVTNEKKRLVPNTPLIDIRGRVLNEKGEPVLASITVKGTAKGTTSNKDGWFVLTGVEESATLIISGVGIETIEVKPDGKTQLEIAVKISVKPLDEIQMIAYGSTTKRFQTGNVSTVKGEEIERQPVANSLLALEGRVPGMFITQQNGLSGSGIVVRIQGQNSITHGNNPLYVVDGVPLVTTLPTTGLDGILGSDGAGGIGSPLSYLNPSDIESIEILKDADATSIYGSRAANGAILITTKKGKPGQTRVDVNMQQGWSKVTRKMDMMNTQQYLSMRNEAFKNDSQTPGSSDYDINGTWDTTRYTDWQKVLIGNTAQYTNINASVSGGTPALQYLFGTSYHRETTIFPLSNDFVDQKGSVHVNLSSVSINQKFHLQLTSNYLIDNNLLPGSDLTRSAILKEPDAPSLYNADGTLNWAPNASGRSTVNNPLQYKYVNYKNKTTNFINNAILSYLIIPGLEIKSSFGYTVMETNDYKPTPLISIAPESRPYSNRAAVYGKRNLSSWIVEPQLSYNKVIGKGKLNALVGATILQNTSNSSRILAIGFNNDAVLEDISAATRIVAFKPIIAEYKYDALFGRLNYSWLDKYIFNLTARRDGSSRFGANNQFHNFGSVGGAWIFSQEGFMQNANFLSFGKLRGSYGTTGNDQIGDYQYLNLYATPYFGGGISYQNVPTLYPQGLPNPYLEWEETRKLQGGIDLGFLKDRILLNVTYARNRSSNELLGYTLPSITGFTEIIRNFPATVQNSSWELSFRITAIKRKSFSWTSNFNLTIPKNKLIEFPNLESSSYASQLIIGQPLDVRKTIHLLGVEPVSGQYHFADSNGNATFSPTYPDDYTTRITTLPKFYGGFQNHFEYKEFQVDFLFQFVRQKGIVMFITNGVTPPGRFVNGASNQPVTFLKHWQKPGDNAPTRAYSVSYPSDVNYAVGSDAVYGDASYIRLKNVSVSWELPSVWKRAIHVQSCRFYTQGQNLLTITHYQGMDPENQSISSLPPLRVLTFGVQVSL